MPGFKFLDLGAAPGGFSSCLGGRVGKQAVGSDCFFVWRLGLVFFCSRGGVYRSIVGSGFLVLG